MIVGFGLEEGEDTVVWPNLAQDGTQVIVVVVPSRLAARSGGPELAAGSVVGGTGPRQDWPQDRSGRWPGSRKGGEGKMALG